MCVDECAGIQWAVNGGRPSTTGGPPQPTDKDTTGHPRSADSVINAAASTAAPHAGPGSDDLHTGAGADAAGTNYHHRAQRTPGARQSGGADRTRTQG